MMGKISATIFSHKLSLALLNLPAHYQRAMDDNPAPPCRTVWFHHDYHYSCNSIKLCANLVAKFFGAELFHSLYTALVLLFWPLFTAAPCPIFRRMESPPSWTRLSRIFASSPNLRQAVTSKQWMIDQLPSAIRWRCKTSRWSDRRYFNSPIQSTSQSFRQARFFSPDISERPLSNFTRVEHLYMLSAHLLPTVMKEIGTTTRSSSQLHQIWKPRPLKVTPAIKQRTVLANDRLYRKFRIR